MHDCRKTNIKIITQANHNRRRQRDELIRIPYNYTYLLKAQKKSRIQGAIDFGSQCFSLVEKMLRDF